MAAVTRNFLRILPILALGLCTHSSWAQSPVPFCGTIFGNPCNPKYFAADPMYIGNTFERANPNDSVRVWNSNSDAGWQGTLFFVDTRDGNKLDSLFTNVDDSHLCPTVDPCNRAINLQGPRPGYPNGHDIRVGDIIYFAYRIIPKTYPAPYDLKPEDLVPKYTGINNPGAYFTQVAHPNVYTGCLHCLSAAGRVPAPHNAVVEFSFEDMGNPMSDFDLNDVVFRVSGLSLATEQVATPIANPLDTGFVGPKITVTLTDATSGATIYYAIDGSTPDSNSTVYTGPLTFTATTTLKAVAYKPGDHHSFVGSWVYSKLAMAVTLPPLADPPGKVFTTMDPDFTVTLTPGEPGSVIHYTLDGRVPDSNSTVYSGPIPVTTTMAIKAIATKSNQIPSPVITAVFTENPAPQVLPPTATPSGKIFNTLDSDFTVLLTSGESGSAIHYTLDGTMPDINSPIYTGPITISTSTIIEAIGTKSNQISSPIMIAVYTENPAPKVATPVANPPGSAAVSPYSFSTPLNVGLSDSTAGATIYFSLNGSAPVASGSVVVSQSGTLKIFATKAGMYPSDTVTVEYNFLAPSSVKVLFQNGRSEPDGLSNPDPTSPPRYVFIPLDRNGNALSGDTEGKCGSCSPGDGTRFVGPIIDLEIPGPVDYDFQILSTLGEFVVSGSGIINEKDLALLDESKPGTYRARIIWTGRSAKGHRAGVGAYILKSNLRTFQKPGSGAPIVNQKAAIVFGLLR